MNELSFWDYITLGIALIVVVIFILSRIRRAMSPTGGCGSCASSCTPSEKQKGCNTPIVSINDITREKD